MSTLDVTREMMAPFAVGDPVKALLPRISGVVCGRVAGFSGTQVRGLWPIIHIATPAGTLIEAGRFYVVRIVSPEDLAKLAGFEEGCPPCPSCGKAATADAHCCHCCTLPEGATRS